MNEPKNMFERLLTLFTRIRPGEGRAVFIYFCYGLLIVASYYIFKTVREPLILSDGNAIDKAYATGVAALVLLAFMPIYTTMYHHCKREVLVAGSAVIFAMMGIGFALAYQAGWAINYVYYVWVSIYGVMMITQFWVFATGSFNVESGKRLFPLILIGASSGGLVGAWAAVQILSLGDIATALMIASILIAITAFLPYWGRDSVPPQSRCVDCDLKTKQSSRLLGGIGVVFQSRFMLLIAMYALLLNIVNSTGEYMFADLVTTKANSIEFADRAQRDQFVGQIYAQFGLLVTTIALFLQMFVVSRLYIRYGVYLTAMIMPLVLTVGYMLGGFFPIFSFIYMLKTIDNSLDYSVTNMTRQALFLPATNEEKSLAKTAIDTLFWRLGDLAQAGIVFVAVKWLNWGVSELAWLCAAICVVWMWVAKGIGNEYLAREAGLQGQSPILNRQLADVIIMPGAPLNVRIPMDTFIGSDPSDLLTVDATLKDGEVLPAWLNFSGKKWRFKGIVPNNQDDKLDVVLIAQDNAGLSVSQSFSLIPILATE